MYFSHYWWSIECQINFYLRLFGNKSILTLIFFYFQNVFGQSRTLSIVSSTLVIWTLWEIPTFPMWQPCTVLDTLIFRNFIIDCFIALFIFHLVKTEREERETERDRERQRGRETERKWIIAPHLTCYDIMDLLIWILIKFPEVSNKASSLLTSITWRGFLQYSEYSDLISHTHTYTERETKTRNRQRDQKADTPIYIYIYIMTTFYVLTVAICVTLKKWFPDINNLHYRLSRCLCFSKITDLYKSHICWLDSIRLSSSHETQRILIKVV